MKRYGGNRELDALEKLLSKVEGGFLKKSKINRQLLQELKDVVLSLQLSADVIQAENKKPDDDEITVLGNY